MRQASIDGHNGLLIGNVSGVIAPTVTTRWYCRADYTGRECDRQVFVGIDEAARPTPEDLQRKKLRPGYDIKLGDGRMYHVPRALAFQKKGAPICAFPAKLEWREGVAYRVCSDAKYQRLLGEAMDLVGQMLAGEVVYDSERALEVLALNYRVGAPEASILGLFDDDAVLEVLQAFCDVKGAMAIISDKKKDSSWNAGSTVVEDSQASEN